MSKKIFISYAREDSATAKRLYDDLKGMGHSPWLDTEDLLPGERWRPRIRRTIGESDFFVVLMSEKSLNKRGFVQKEVRKAIRELEAFQVTISSLSPFVLKSVVRVTRFLKSSIGWTCFRRIELDWIAL